MSCCITADILLTLTARILDEGGRTPQLFRRYEKQRTEPFPIIWASQPNHRDTEEKMEKDQLCSGGACCCQHFHTPSFTWYFCIA